MQGASITGATLNISSGLTVASNAIHVASSMVTVAFSTTPFWTSTDQGKISIGSDYPEAIVPDYNIRQRGTLELLDFDQGGMKYGRTTA